MQRTTGSSGSKTSASGSSGSKAVVSTGSKTSASGSSGSKAAGAAVAKSTSVVGSNGSAAAVKSAKVVGTNGSSAAVKSTKVVGPSGDVRLTHYNPGGDERARDRSWERDEAYMKWKNNCTYVEYCKIRKFLKWRKDNNYRDDNNFRMYLNWKHTNYTDHKYDNYYYNDYTVFKRCYDNLDHDMFRAWKKWHSNKKEFKSENKDYHKYRNQTSNPSIAVIKVDKNADSDDDDFSISEFSHSNALPKNNSSKNSSSKNSSSKNGGSTDSAGSKPSYLEKAVVVRNRKYIDFKKNATISDFIDYQHYNNWETYATKHHIDIANLKKYRKFVEEAGSPDHDTIAAEFEAWKNLNSREDYNEWQKYWMWRMNFQYYQHHAKRYNPRTNRHRHPAASSTTDLSESSDSSDSSDSDNDNNGSDSDNDNKCDNLIQILNLEPLLSNNTNKNNKNNKNATNKKKNDSDNEDDDIDSFTDDVSYQIACHENDDDEFGDLDEIAKRELHKPTLKQQRAARNN